MGITDRKKSINIPISTNLDLNQEPTSNAFIVQNNFKGGGFVGRKKSGNVFAGSKLNVPGQGIYNEKNVTPDLFKKLLLSPTKDGGTPIACDFTYIIRSIPNNTTPTPTNTVTPTNTPTPTPTPTPTEPPRYRFLPNLGSSTNEEDGANIVDFQDNGTSAYFYGYFTGYSQNDIVTPAKHIIKLNQDLTIDYSFTGGTGFNEIRYDGESILQQPDGKIVATGVFTSYSGVSKNRIVRLNVDGSIDNTFNIGSGFNWYTQRPGIDSLGNIIVPGLFDTYNGVTVPMFHLAKLSSGGTMNMSFSATTGFVGATNIPTVGVLVNPDDSMYITGYFTTFSGISANRIIKLYSNGYKDDSFNYGTGLNSVGYNPVHTLRISGETSFYVLGSNYHSSNPSGVYYGYTGFTTYNGTPVNRILKLMSDGTIDPTFNSGAGFYVDPSITGDTNDGGLVSFSTIIWTNKLLLKGTFTSYNGTPSVNFIILNSDGTVFQSFTTKYEVMFTIGNKLYGSVPNGYLTLLMTYPL